MTAPRTTPPPDWLRHAVRGVLEQSPGYQAMQPSGQRALAQAMVKVSALAAALIAEEADADAAIEAVAPPQRRRAPLARAQEAPGFGAAADRIAGITRNVLNAVSFPRFVTDLINGVFKSMIDSNAQQMQLYVQLLNNVSASAEGFERSQFSIVSVRSWVAEHFPDQIEYDLPEVEPGDDPPDPEELASITLRLKPNASMPEPEALRAVLGLGPEESVEAGNPEQLVPLARRAIARQRQQMLATMVMLGMQRIVIDSGRINASMRFHIDTRSAATEDRSSEFGMQNRIKAAGSFGYGPWGASAEVENAISYVSTQRSQSTEEINTDLELNSSVELVFKTDYLPLERLAGGPQIERIKVNTLNPDAENKAATEARTARDKASREAEAKRADATTKATKPPALSPAQAGGAGSVQDADRARAAAGQRQAGGQSGQQAGRSGQQTTQQPAQQTTQQPAQQTTQQPGQQTTQQPAQQTTQQPAQQTTQQPAQQTTQQPAQQTTQQPAQQTTQQTTQQPAQQTTQQPAQQTTQQPAAQSGQQPAGKTAQSGATRPAAQAAALAANDAARQPDVVFVPTPPEAIDTMLSLAAPRRGETLLDLGCGDGRIVVAAALRSGCRAIGYDIDPQRIAEARARIAAAGVGDCARVEQRDLFGVDLSEADVVTLYLLPTLNVKLIPQLQRLRPGTRVVSHDFAIAGVTPDRVVQDYLPRLGMMKTYFLFTAPLRLQDTPAHQWRESARMLWEEAAA